MRPSMAVSPCPLGRAPLKRVQRVVRDGCDALVSPCPLGRAPLKEPRDTVANLIAAESLPARWAGPR